MLTGGRFQNILKPDQIPVLILFSVIYLYSHCNQLIITWFITSPNTSSGLMTPIAFLDPSHPNGVVLLYSQGYHYTTLNHCSLKPKVSLYIYSCSWF